MLPSPTVAGGACEHLSQISTSLLCSELSMAPTLLIAKAKVLPSPRAPAQPALSSPCPYLLPLSPLLTPFSNAGFLTSPPTSQAQPYLRTVAPAVPSSLRHLHGFLLISLPFFFFFFSWSPYQHMKVSRPESNLSQSCDLCHSYSKARSLTHCIRLGIEQVPPQRQLDH